MDKERLKAEEKISQWLRLVLTSYRRHWETEGKEKPKASEMAETGELFDAAVEEISKHLLQAKKDGYEECLEANCGGYCGTTKRLEEMIGEADKEGFKRGVRESARVAENCTIDLGVLQHDDRCRENIVTAIRKLLDK